MKFKDIEFVEQRLGYTFSDKKLLVRALTRKAFAQEQKHQDRSCEDQEIYRILGDAILKAILVEMLIEKGYDSRETITSKKSDLEKRENLGRMLQKMDLASYIRFGQGERKQDISKRFSVLGETFEALIAAIYIDRGSYEGTKNSVIKMFAEEMHNSLPQTLPSKATKNSELDVVQELWIGLNSCGHCMHSDICARMMTCMFDLSDSD